MRSFVIVILILSGFLASFAQPINDNCSDALLLTEMEDTCFVQSFEGATFDLYNGTCVSFPFSWNIWYKFVAVSSSIDVEVLVPGSVTASITLIHFDGAACSVIGITELGCAEGELIIENSLSLGETYYFIITIPNSETESFGLCIDHQPINVDPPNDYVCFAELMTPDSTCVSGTTVNATPDFPNPGCPIAAEATVWYKTQLEPGFNAMEVSLANISLGGDISIMLAEFDFNNCTATPNFVDSYCGPADTTIEFRLLSAGKHYYLQLASEAADTGAFEICMNQTAPPAGCAENDECEIAYNISIPSNNTICNTGCNIGATPGRTDIIGNCFYMPNPTVWYEFNTDQHAGYMTLELSSDTLHLPQIAVYVANSCNDLTPVKCIVGNDGYLWLEIDSISINRTYYIAVSEVLGNTGHFELCVDIYGVESSCNFTNELVVTNTTLGSPLSGPYQTGEEVSFCYRINYWENTGCNWLQAIIPFFGNGWDEESFFANGLPRQMDSQPDVHSDGQWYWFSHGVAEYNIDNPYSGMSAGEPLPAGWYFVRNDVMSNDPDDSRGDGESCNLSDNFTWEVCFTLTAMKYPLCDSVPGNINCGVVMKTYSDFEVGDWEIEGCLIDDYKFYSADLNCCQGPFVPDQELTLCNNEPFFFDLHTVADPTAIYEWEVVAPPSISGASSGSGQFIDQPLVNNGINTTEVIYYVRGSYPEVCTGEAAVFSVKVVPELYAIAGASVTICEGVSHTLGGEPTASGGSGLSYSFQWSDGLDPVSNPELIATTTQTYYVTVTDEDGCTKSDSVLITVLPKPHASISGFHTVCGDEPAQLRLEFEGVPPFTFRLTEDGIAGNIQQTMDTLYFLDFQISDEGSLIQFDLFHDSRCTGDTEGNAIIQRYEHKNTSVDTTICIGSFIVLNGNIFDSPGTYTETLVGQALNGCDSTVEMTLDFMQVISIEVISSTGDDGSGNGSIDFEVSGGTPPYSFDWDVEVINLDSLEAGEYSVTITDANGCEALFGFEIAMVNSVFDFKNNYNLKLFPNPTDQGISQVVLKGNEFYKFDILSTTGEIMKSGLLPQNHLLKWEEARSGLYLVIIRNEAGDIFIGKWIVK